MLPRSFSHVQIYRLIITLLIGIASASISYNYQQHFDWVGGDMIWPHCAAQMLVQQRDPYRFCAPIPSNEQTLQEKLQHWPTNPLTAALPFIVTIPLSPDIAAALFIGLASALLAFGLLRTGEYWRLYVFLAFPYWQALQAVQWSVLFLALTYSPSLLFLTLCKPQLGIPVILPRLSRRAIFTCVVFGMLSLLLLPDWPWRWWAQARQTYNGFVPIITLPFGPLLALAALAWRRKCAQTLILLACVPQRAFYDQLLLWVIPATQKQVLMLVACSWLGYLGWFYLSGFGGSFWVVVCMYLPALGMVLLEEWNTKQRELQAAQAALAADHLRRARS
jgi:hypothetical protein